MNTFRIQMKLCMFVFVWEDIIQQNILSISNA